MDEDYYTGEVEMSAETYGFLITIDTEEIGFGNTSVYGAYMINKIITEGAKQFRCDVLKSDVISNEVPGKEMFRAAVVIMKKKETKG